MWFTTMIIILSVRLNRLIKIIDKILQPECVCLYSPVDPWWRIIKKKKKLFNHQWCKCFCVVEEVVTHSQCVCVSETLTNCRLFCAQLCTVDISSEWNCALKTVTIFFFFLLCEYEMTLNYFAVANHIFITSNNCSVFFQLSLLRVVELCALRKD